MEVRSVMMRIKYSSVEELFGMTNHTGITAVNYLRLDPFDRHSELTETFNEYHCPHIETNTNGSQINSCQLRPDTRAIHVAP